MDTIGSALQGIGVFAAGALARLGIFLAALAVLAIPALAIALMTRWFGRLRRRALKLSDAGGFTFSGMVSYAPGHTWVAPSRRGLRVGVDDLAQRLLPWAGRIELPMPGREVREGEPVAALSNGSRTLTVMAPVAGTVVDVNRAVLRDPSLVKRDGYSRGWLFAIKPADARYTLFPRGEPARDWLEREGQRLSGFVLDCSAVAADGGELVAQAPWLLSDDDWKKLAQTFLAAR
jgi:glycine cleavage system H protein